VTQSWEGGVKLVLDKPNKDKDTPQFRSRFWIGSDTVFAADTEIGSDLVSAADTEIGSDAVSAVDSGSAAM
jgi:hypothetical protein